MSVLSSDGFANCCGRGASRGNVSRSLRILRQHRAAGGSLNLSHRNTPGLHYAVIWEQLDIVRYLLSEGVDTNATDGGGRTALDRAVAAGYDEIASEIRQHSGVAHHAAGGSGGGAAGGAGNSVVLLQQSSSAQVLAAWRHAYELEAARISGVVSSVVTDGISLPISTGVGAQAGPSDSWQICHVGSTSVGGNGGGLDSKPYVDIAVQAPVGSNAGIANVGDVIRDTLCARGGYTPASKIFPEMGPSCPVLFRPHATAACQGFFVHIDPVANVSLLLQFRDALNSSAELRAQYVELKQAIALRSSGFVDYTSAKTAFVLASLGAGCLRSSDGLGLPQCEAVGAEFDLGISSSDPSFGRFSDAVSGRYHVVQHPGHTAGYAFQTCIGRGFRPDYQRQIAVNECCKSQWSASVSPIMLQRDDGGVRIWHHPGNLVPYHEDWVEDSLCREPCWVIQATDGAILGACLWRIPGVNRNTGSYLSDNGKAYGPPSLPIGDQLWLIDSTQFGTEPSSATDVLQQYIKDVYISQRTKIQTTLVSCTLAPVTTIQAEDFAEPEPEPGLEECEPPYAAEIAGLSVKVLKRRAKALGATPDQIEDLYDATDIKAAAVQLTLSLRAALDKMKVKALRAHLRAIGASEQQIDDLDEAENIKVAAIDLVLQIAASTDEGGAPGPRPEPDSQANGLGPLSLSHRTFGKCKFKPEYEKTNMVPIKQAAQIIAKIPEFVHTYCHVHGLTSESQRVAAQAFAERLQQEAGQHAQGGAGDLIAPVQATAVLLWTSASLFEGMGEEHCKEFCSLLNAAIRDDNELLVVPAATITRGINALCLEGRAATPLPFPPGPLGATDPQYRHDGPRGTTYRGGGFDDAHRDFFEVGKAYRVPGFLATSFQESKAMQFARMAEARGLQSVLWEVRVDPAGEHDTSKRCKHVNFVSNSLIVDALGNPIEQEYLFTAYSIFTVRAVTWGVDGAMHRIEIDAASDNRVDAEGCDDGRWATPAGSEDLPLAPWY